MKIIKWVPRILTIAILALGLSSFYRYITGDEIFFLPDSIVLARGSLIYVGLILGWIYPKIGGWMIIISIVIGFVYSGINDFNPFGLVPLTEIIFFYSINIPTIIAGILYLIDGYKKSNK